ncbi:MAG: hypothetical protein HZB39_19300 [Planctomycetes bacterium]|nr:hypothetical protein [Planctomycetota bacterium]
MIASAWPFAAASLLGALLALWIHRRMRGFLPEDPPGPGRKRHPRPTPMLGAWPALVACACAWSAEARWLAACTALAGACGLCDDLRKARGHGGLDWRIKAIALSAAAGLGVAEIGIGAGDAPRAVLLGALLFCVINAVNFLDNQDGVALALGGVGLAAIARRDGDPLAVWLCAIWRSRAAPARVRRTSAALVRTRPARRARSRLRAGRARAPRDRARALEGRSPSSHASAAARRTAARPGCAGPRRDRGRRRVARARGLSVRAFRPGPVPRDRPSWSPS